MLFDELGLSAELLRAIHEQGYRQATPIQEHAIPMVLDGRDILAGAQTGTGKTAGFMLPLLQRLWLSRAAAHRKGVRALILTPTRELAAQVAQSARDYGRYLPLATAEVYGGVNINPQIAKLRRGVDILVATPGRLLDHVERNTVDLSTVEVLVLDEADRMLDMGFIHDIRRILALLPKRRQNLLFSATFPVAIRRLAADLLNAPKEIQVAADNATADNVRQLVYPVDQHRKRELLSHRIGVENWRQVLVFTRTKHGANRLAAQLCRDGLNSVAIHGNKTQAARTRALADFKRGAVRVLVATDIAARGLDIERLPHVVNYELPHVPEDYVHRIGRTARAGEEGHAISLVCNEEQKLLRDIERLLKREIEQQIIPGYETQSPAKTEIRQSREGQPQRTRPGRPGAKRKQSKLGKANVHRQRAGRKARAQRPAV